MESAQRPNLQFRPHRGRPGEQAASRVVLLLRRHRIAATRMAAAAILVAALVLGGVEIVPATLANPLTVAETALAALLCGVIGGTFGAALGMVAGDFRGVYSDNESFLRRLSVPVALLGAAGVGAAIGLGLTPAHGPATVALLAAATVVGVAGGIRSVASIS